METLIKAPPINNINIHTLSANYASLTWDDVGRNFYYLIEIRNVTHNGDWLMLTHVSEPKYTLTDLIKETEYQVRISVSSRGFERSDWAYSENFKTFMYNMYTFSMMNEMTLADKFIDEKFTENNRNYVNFNNDAIFASLMTNDFVYNPSIPHVSYISDGILRRQEYHELTCNVAKLCTDVDRVMIGYIDEVIYMVERYQKLARVSNDKGQTWQLIDLFDGRIGDPITNTVFSQNEITTFSLGYNHLFDGRPSSNVRWSSIKERFSQTNVSFTRMDDQNNLGFEIELFNRYAKLPDIFDNGKAEAFVATNDKVFVGGSGVAMFVDLKNEVYDMDPTSPTFNQRIFDETVIKIVNDPNLVIKKMDSIGNKVLVLVSGVLKTGKLNKHNVDNIGTHQDIGVYQINEDLTVERVFGNTKEERYYIEHKYTNMSTNGREFIIGYANYKNMDVVTSTHLVGDDASSDEVSEIIVSEVVKRRGFLNSAKHLMGSFRAKPTDTKTWEKGFMKYYNECDFTFMARTGNRSFITSSRQIGIVHGARNYTKIVDTEGIGSDNRISKETWQNGEVLINLPNIEFSDFNSYASGILLYQSGGQIIGFYEFAVSTISEVSLVWKPKHTLLHAKMLGQTRSVYYVEPEIHRPEDPNLVPFIKKMIPDNYFRESDIEQSRYYDFIKNYLEYLSDGRSSSYIGTTNVIRNKNPIEVDSFEYLWSEMYKRNIYIDSKKKEETIRFFLAHESDFYSAKGTLASYKFLFKLLYNEDVDIDDETDVMNYYITADMDNIDQSIIGQTIFTATGRCLVTNIERTYIDGKKRWQLTVGSMIGAMKKGQKLRSENGRYTGMVEENLNGKMYLYNDLDYINNGRSYYVMRIKSKLPLSRYKDDIIRFVHPLGVGFKGIVDITLFMNAGINMKHIETTIDKMLALKFDMGYPTHYPDRVLKLDSDGKPILDDVTGKLIYLEHPKNGEEFIIDVDKYDNDNQVDPATIKNSVIRNYVTKYKPSQRRSRYSPTFDTSSTAMSKYRLLAEGFIQGAQTFRLKDHVGNPRDPSASEATQKKLNEELK